MVLKAIGFSIWNFLLTTNVKYTATYLLSPRTFKGLRFRVYGLIHQHQKRHLERHQVTGKTPTAFPRLESAHHCYKEIQRKHCILITGCAHQALYINTTPIVFMTESAET
jgi:hypothetical protein